MANELILQRLKEGYCYKAKIVLNNDYIYVGLIGKCDDKWVEINLDRGGGIKLIVIDEIKEVLIYHQEMGEVKK